MKFLTAAGIVAFGARGISAADATTVRIDVFEEEGDMKFKTFG